MAGSGVRELLVFLKAPRLGAVKTRLALAIGDDLALEIYQSMTNAVLRKTCPKHSEPFRRVLCFAPQDAESEIAAWFQGEVLEPQQGSDLGARMRHAFANSFARGAGSTVLIGTDCPTLDRASVAAAFTALETADAVLRGAEDGGYTLIGLTRPEPLLFTGIEWSTNTVLATTLARASEAGLRLRVLGQDTDIDTIDDLRRHFPKLRPQLDPGLARRIEAIL